MNQGNTRPNIPTAVIAVGGAGGRILHHVRKRLTENSSAVRSQVSFLHVDADHNAPPPDGCAPFASDEVVLLPEPKHHYEFGKLDRPDVAAAEALFNDQEREAISAGFHGRPSIGSALPWLGNQDNLLNKALSKILQRHRSIFVIGTDAGGTGGGLIPVIPEMIRSLSAKRPPRVQAIVFPPPSFGLGELAFREDLERSFLARRRFCAMNEVQFVTRPDESYGTPGEEDSSDVVLSALSESGIPIGQLYLPVYQPLLAQLEPARVQLIEVNDELLKRLAKYPSLAYELDPRKFEELVAEVWHRLGHKVTLTPRTRDGGKDVYAVQEGPAGKLLYIIECKRFSPERPVRVEVVRSLYGVTQRERATKGIIATTSYFTKAAIEFQSTLQYQLALADFRQLSEWYKSFYKR